MHLLKHPNNLFHSSTLFDRIELEVGKMPAFFKKVIKFNAISFLLCFIFNKAAFAANIPVPAPEGAANKDLLTIISQITGLLVYIVGAVAVLFLILAGFQFIISAGNPQGVQNAKNTALYVIIGLAVVLISGSAVHFIIQRLQA